MVRSILATSALALLCACGDGAPFGGITGSDGDAGTGTTSAIPEDVASNQTAFTYDPINETLTVSGTFKEGDQATTTYRRRVALDRGAYQAYTAQDDPLDSHATVYVRTLGTVTGNVTILGTQFGRFRGGSGYVRTGPYTRLPGSEASDSGLATYAGRYVGLTNLNGERTDIAPINVNLSPTSVLQGDTSGTIINDPAGVAEGVIPNQAGVVDGTIFITVAFDDATGNVSGVITNRTVNSYAFGTLTVSDIVLGSADLQEDGTFAGSVEPRGSDTELGQYGGIIGGTASESLAGSLYAKAHYGDTTDATGATVSIQGEEEFGVFVLGRCKGPLEDASPECAAVE